MKKNILFYGNCQMSPISMILNLDTNKYNIITIECFSTQITKVELDNWISQCNIIIMQPIQDNYREKYYLSSNYIILMSNISLKDFLKKYTAISSKFINEYYKFYELCENNKFGIL